MLKKISGFIISVALLLNIAVISSQAASTEDSSAYDTATVTKIISKTNVFDLKAKSSILVDSISGNILVENNSHEKLPIASVTKIMSLLLVMEAIDSGKITLKDMVPVSEYTYGMGGSQVYLKPGEEFSVVDMLKAVAIHSANDATVALAEKIAGSEEAFVTMMNDKAKAIGMKDTYFLDSTGLTDDGHYSSAYDIAFMSRELLTKHPRITEYTSIWHDTFRDGKFSLDNTNKLVRYYEGTNGLKTGFTSKAGYCLSVSAKRSNLQLIAVVLGEPDSNTRFAESRKMLDYGFANYETTVIDKKGAEIATVNVKKGLKTSIKAILGNDVQLLLKKGQKDKISRNVTLENVINAPVKAGQKIGEVIYKADGKEIGRVGLVADSSVDKASFIRLFFRMVMEWFGIGRQ